MFLAAKITLENKYLAQIAKNYKKGPTKCN